MCAPLHCTALGSGCTWELTTRHSSAGSTSLLAGQKIIVRLTTGLRVDKIWQLAVSFLCLFFHFLVAISLGVSVSFLWNHFIHTHDLLCPQRTVASLAARWALKERQRHSCTVPSCGVPSLCPILSLRHQHTCVCSPGCHHTYT